MKITLERVKSLVTPENVKTMTVKPSYEKTSSKVVYAVIATALTLTARNIARFVTDKVEHRTSVRKRK